MSFEISGKLIEKYATANISDKFKKRDFVIEKKENSNGFEFVDFIKFQLVQDKCSLIDNVNVGDEIKVSFNLRGRKWEKDGKISYFTNLEAWRIETDRDETRESAESGTSVDDVPMPDEGDFSAPSSSKNDDLDNLPF